MKRVILIALVTAICVLAGFAYLYFKPPEVMPVPSTNSPAALDLAGLKAKAEQGDAQSQTQLGKAFANGEGVPRDYKEAARWYGQAASNGNVQAEAVFGELYQAGQGVRRDLTNAVRWFTKAAQGGSTGAQYDLGFIYEQGQGIPRNEHLAAQWYHMAAEGGNALAQFDYGQRCLLGMGVAPDPVEGLKWLLLAAALGQKDARLKADSIQKNLSSAQIAEARRRMAAFTPRPAAR